MPRPSKLFGLRPRKSRTRGSAMLISRSRNSYMRALRSVTLQPIGLTVAQLVGRDRLARLGDHRLLAGDQREIGGGRVDLLAVVDALADAHVEHDLVDRRHLHAVLVAELLGELAADLLVELRPAGAAVTRSARARLLACGLRRRAFAPSSPLPLAPAFGALSAFSPWRASPPARLRARFAGFLAFLSSLSAIDLGSRTLGDAHLLAVVASPMILKPTRVGLPSFGSASAMLDRWIGASLEMMPPSCVASAAGGA